MDVLLLSGGSGKRLWPLSNEVRSKQFLKLLKNETGDNESMIQRICRQIKIAGLDSSLTIATGEAQAEAIQNQIDGITRADILTEPERRDTYPAVLLSCAYLYYEKRSSLDESVAVIPIDPYVDNNYFDLIKHMGKIAEKSSEEVILMGIKPTYTATGFGYILPSEKHVFDESNNTKYMHVQKFIEKPDADTANKLIGSGALWNSGVFVFKLRYIINILKEKYNVKNYSDAKEIYSKLPVNSFDYEIVENAKSLGMVEYTGMWKDIGTWENITSVMEDKITGRVCTDKKLQNTNVINELDIPLVAMGLTDTIVAASPDGILVADKNAAHDLKKYLKDDIKRPMYEARRWGEYKVINYCAYRDGLKALTKQLIIQKGKRISYQMHKKRDEIWTITDGIGKLCIDGEYREVKRGDVVKVERGKKHGIEAIERLEIIEIQMGEELTEEDIFRFENI
ncbi:MAG: cupin domain-containing protein [Firmicutes bacterium]|nr:cupin domain-containing protein [Bacillota bacterium]